MNLATRLFSAGDQTDNCQWLWLKYAYCWSHSTVITIILE